MMSDLAGLATPENWWLLAQHLVDVSGGRSSGLTYAWILILVLGAMAGIALIISLVKGHESQQLERLRMIELGRPAPAPRLSPFWTTGWLAAGMGLVVPLVALKLAADYSARFGAPNTGMAWLAAAIVAAMGIVAGTTLTLRTSSLAMDVARLEREAGVPAETGKPGALDLDELDTAGRREAVVAPTWSNLNGGGPGSG